MRYYYLLYDEKPKGKHFTAPELRVRKLSTFYFPNYAAARRHAITLRAYASLCGKSVVRIKIKKGRMP